MRTKLDMVELRVNGHVVLDMPIDLALIQELLTNKPIFDGELICADHIEIVIKRKYEKIGFFTWLSKRFVTKQLPIIQAYRDITDNAKQIEVGKDEQKSG